MRPDSIPPNDNTHHGIGHVAKRTAPDLKLITTGTHADWFLLDQPSRADFLHRWNAGTHRADPKPTPPCEVDWFALGKDICSRDLPAGLR